MSLVLCMALPLLFGCADPVSWETTEEFQFCWAVLDAYFLYRERLPQDPYSVGGSATEPPKPSELLASVNDPYTRYFPPDSSGHIKQVLTTRVSMGGLGIQADSVGTGYLISHAWRTSAGYRGGLRVGDTIVALDGVPVAGQNSGTVNSLLSDTMGNTIIVTVRSADGEDSVSLVHGPVYLPSVDWYSVDSGIAVIRLMTFTDSSEHPDGSAGEFREALDSTASYSSTILDLRHNLGGSLNQCIAITSEFIPRDGPIILFVDRFIDLRFLVGRTGKTEYLSGGGSGKWYNRKLFILVDEYTASASEVLLSGLRDQRRADITIIGTRTYGKGTGWYGIDSPRRGFVTVTGLEFKPLNYDSYNLVGIEPDITVAPGESAFQIVRDLIGGSGLGRRVQGVWDEPFPPAFIHPLPPLPLCLLPLPR